MNSTEELTTTDPEPDVPKTEKVLDEKDYSLYLGCVIPNRYPMIEKASRTVLTELGARIKDMNGASCCPAPGVFRSVDKITWLTLGARNINIAEQNGSDLLTLCNGCFGTLHEVAHELDESDELKGRINEVLETTGREYKGTSKVRHIMDVLYYDVGLDKLRQLTKHKLNLRVAVHYGCHILKPSAIQTFGQDPENPTFFDEVIEALGATSVDYRKKQMCCGAGGAVRTANKLTSTHLTLSKLREIRRVGADCIVVCCPFCQLQYDLGQLEVKAILEEGEEPYSIPVVYVTQLVGLAMGLDPMSLGMIRPTDLGNVSPFISVEKLLEKLGLKAKGDAN
jgi:heterodisulfide reductase subunit B